MNGSGGDYGGQPQPAYERSSGMQQPSPEPAFRINVGFTMNQVLAGFATLGTLLSAAVTAGWLFIPAKAEDLTKVAQVVQTVQTEHNTTRERLVAVDTSVGRLTIAVEALTRAVGELKDSPPQVIERVPLPAAPPEIMERKRRRPTGASLAPSRP